MSKFASREQLLKTAPRRFVEAGPLPVSGLTVRIQSLTAREVVAFKNASWRKNKTGPTFDSAAFETQDLLQVAMCLVDEAGHRLFRDDEATMLGEDMDAADFEFVLRAVRKHVGRIESTEDMEAEGKNSGETPSDAPR